MKYRALCFMLQVHYEYFENTFFDMVIALITLILLHMYFRLFKTTILPIVRAKNNKRLLGKYAFKSIFVGVDIVSH